MLKRVDRVQIAVPDNASAERTVSEVFGGELIGRDDLSILHAKRSTMQIGSSLVELLAPGGAGAIGDFVAKYGSGLYGAGFSVADLAAAARHLESNGVKFERARDSFTSIPKQPSDSTRCSAFIMSTIRSSTSDGFTKSLT